MTHDEKKSFKRTDRYVLCEMQHQCKNHISDLSWWELVPFKIVDSNNLLVPFKFTGQRWARCLVA